jgi:hypothetical protein
LLLRLLLFNFTTAKLLIEGNAMLRVLLSLLLTIFLFTSIIGTTNSLFQSQNSNEVNVIAQVSEKKDSKLSIKEIETVTSSNNLPFTYANSLR